MPVIEQLVQINIGPEDLARAFLEMDSDGQAAFLQAVGHTANKEWGRFKANCQWLMVGETLASLEHGRHFVATLAACAEEAAAVVRPQVEWQTHHDPRTAAPPGCTGTCVFPGKCTAPCPAHVERGSREG